MHAFVDESERSGYLLCAVLVSPNHLDQVRSALRQMRRPGERRIHFVKESGSRRREVLAALPDTELRARVYTRRGPPVAARQACLEQLLDDLAVVDATRLVIESRQGRDQHDRHVLSPLFVRAVVLPAWPTNISVPTRIHSCGQRTRSPGPTGLAATGGDE